MTAPRRFVGHEENELWTVRHDLVLADDGTFMLERTGQGAAAHVNERLTGDYVVSVDGQLLLRPSTAARAMNGDGSAELVLVRTASGGYVDASGIELVPSHG